MFARTAEIITKKLRENNSITNEQYEICRFGFQQGLTIVLNILTTMIIGIVIGELRFSILFMVLYVPLRSNAGGYHAHTAVQCYIYSIFMMIAILFAMKYLIIPSFICIIILVVSYVIIWIFAPVEDTNKILDNIELIVYRRRTRQIMVLEVVLFILSSMFNKYEFSQCIMLVFFVMAMILFAGKFKNSIIG